MKTKFKEAGILKPKLERSREEGRSRRLTIVDLASHQGNLCLGIGVESIQASWSYYSSIEVSIRRIICASFPLKWERFWPLLIAYILCLLSLYDFCIGSCLMIKNTNNIRKRRS